MEDGPVLTLLSGGIDSSTVVSVLLESTSEIVGIFVDYGQPAALSEWEAARNIAEHFGIPVRRVELGFPLESNGSEYLVRNALLVLIAAGITKAKPLRIALGIHALSEYFDTTPLFLRQVQRLLDGYFSGSVTLTAPLLSETKAEVVQLARNKGVPLELTFSCETQNSPACGACPSCRDRMEFNV